MSIWHEYIELDRSKYKDYEFYKEVAPPTDYADYIPIQINTVENKPQTEDSTGEEA